MTNVDPTGSGSTTLQPIGHRFFYTVAVNETERFYSGVRPSSGLDTGLRIRCIFSRIRIQGQAFRTPRI